MLNKCTKIFLIIALLICNMEAKTQQDTIVIYEDVIVYDTVVVYDTVIVPQKTDTLFPINSLEINILQIDTLTYKANLLHISPYKTATIPINYVIVKDNVKNNIEQKKSTNNIVYDTIMQSNAIKNFTEMKKISFFGIMLLAFNSMVLAQTNYQVSLGTGLWWQNGEIQYIKKPYSALFDVGAFAKRNFNNTNLGLKTGLEYAYLLSTGKYKFNGAIDVWHSLNGSDCENINRNYSSGLHYFSIPLLLFFDKYKIQPYLGINYNAITTSIQTSSVGTKYVNNTHNFGVNIGFGVVLTEKISISLDYKHNLTSDYGENIIGDDNINSALGESFKLKNNQTKVSFLYTFK